MKTKEIISIRANGSKRVQSVNDEPELTQQHLKDSVSITSILERYHRTGEFHHVNKTPGVYGDFTSYEDLRSSIHKVKSAQSQFDALPSQVRSKFGNDPAQLIEYLQNPLNNKEAIELGFKVPLADSQPAQNDDKTTNQGVSSSAQGPQA